MKVEIQNATLSNVWQESFTNRETGENVEFWRALVNVPGEAPAQFGVARDDVEKVTPFVGDSGIAVVNLDARPGSRIRVYLVGFEM